MGTAVKRRRKGSPKQWYRQWRVKVLFEQHPEWLSHTSGWWFTGGTGRLFRKLVKARELTADPVPRSEVR